MKILEKLSLATRIAALEWRYRNVCGRIEIAEKEIRTIMSTVADLAAKQQQLSDAVGVITTGLGTLKTNLEQSVKDLEDQVAALKDSQPNLDLSSLDSSLSNLQSVATSIQSLSDEAKAADPGPAPAPPPVNT